MVNQTIHNILRLIQSRQASSFLINGPPGSGKSHLLEILSQQIPKRVSGMANSFGPYFVADKDLTRVGHLLLASLWKEGYLTKNPVECPVQDLASIWEWVEKNCYISKRQTFIILIDLPYLSDNNLPAYCELLSNVRSLEGTWKSDQIRFCHILAGFWDIEWVKIYSQETGISFPYTEEENHFYWQGVSPIEFTLLVNDLYSEAQRVPVIQTLLYEITDGNPTLTKEILSRLPDDVLNFTNLIKTAWIVAEKSQSLLTKSTQYLDEKSREFLGELLIDQFLPGRLYSPYHNRLLASGLVKEEPIGKQTYIRFRSWFYELLVRLHGHTVGIPQESAGKIRVDELMPLIRSLNQELYRLINDIETQARNFLVIQLSLRHDNTQPLLSGLLEDLDKSNSVVDAHQRAIIWRNKVCQNIAYSDLNPIVSYLSTRDLANIIKELASIYNVKEWREIGQAIYKMADIRDAVMHNQLVDDEAIEHLYDLQIQIYSSLAQAKNNK